MISKFLQRLTLAAVLVGGVSLVLAQPAHALPRPGAPRSRPEPASGFSLFAGAVGLAANANRVSCGLSNRGWQCTDYTNSSVLGGAYWPKGSPDQYVFNGGLQIAGIIPGSKASFAWAGDTVGAFFFDATGFYAVGSGLTNIYSSTNTDDLANWPSAAYAKDPTLYDPSLLGRASVSEQDTWVRYWDGNTNYVLGRPHPMGLLVDQRTLAWNFPSGNQDILYFVDRFINITATDPTKYAALTQYGYSASDITDIVTVAQQYKAGMLAKFGVTVPDSGYWFTNVYAGPEQDPDVISGGGSNYSTAVLPFSMDFAYQSNFLSPTWQYPPSIFGAPFATSPGFEGLKFLRGPANASGQQIGVTMFTNTTNGGVFTDRANVAQMWRLASNNLAPADGTCNAPSYTPLCQLVQGATDTRMYMYSGPITIKPGESQVIVTAMVYAPAVAAAVANDGAGQNLGSATFDLKPGVPGTPTGLISATSRIGQLSIDTIRKIDRAVGWAVTAANPLNNASALDANADGILQQTEIPTVPRSLLNKAMVGQAVFDAKFLLPFAPVSPGFYLVPGDNQVTVVWQPSITEQAGHGDPYFAVASNPLSALYDPDYRANDVEGYRIWRGRTQSAMSVIAQFDYVGTTMTDYTGQFSNDDYGLQCAPDIGVTTTCPAFPHSVQLVGNVIQVPPGGHAQLVSLNIINATADTAITGGNSGYPALRDTGVPFAYVDNTVRDGFRYFYAVTAFDVNSVRSGPTSLQSGLAAKDVTPRAPSGQEVAGALSAPAMVGGDGTTLNTAAPLPTISAATGIFSGPMPPTNGFSAGFAAFVPAVLSSGAVNVSIDSIVPGEYFNGTRATTYFMTGQGAGSPVHFTAGLLAGPTDAAVVSKTVNFKATPMDSAQTARFGGDASFSLFGATTVSAMGDYMLGSKARGAVNSIISGASYSNGPRWWAGAANENTNDPNGIVCGTVASYSCVLGDLSRNAGAIAGDSIFWITSYNTVASSAPSRVIEGVTSGIMRAADFKWYWGTAGAVDSVVDVTHHTRVPFNAHVRASWGILNDSSFTNVTAASTYDKNNALLTWSDYTCVDPFPVYLGYCGGAAATSAFFMNHAKLTPVSFRSSTVANTALLTATGNGFILYLNGQFFLMELTALPAAGTVWNMRDYTGMITGTAGTYAYNGAAFTRAPAVPGLKIRISYTGSSFSPATTTDSMLAAVHTVPDPYYVTNSLELTANTKVLRFVNLPAQAIVRIYSVSGVLVNVLTHNDAGAGGELVWNLRNRNNQFVASGVYFYHVETPDGRTKIGRFTVVNYAQ